MSTEKVNNSQNQMENSEIKNKTIDHTFRLGSNPDRLGENDEPNIMSAEKTKNSPIEIIENQNFDGKTNICFSTILIF